MTSLTLGGTPVTQNQFQVIMTGESAAGDADAVTEKLAKLFRIEPAKAAGLLRGRRDGREA